MDQKLSALFARRENYQKKIKGLTEKFKYVVFFGCGIMYRSLINDTWAKCIGKPVDFCCDSNPEKWGTYICGVKCLSPDELKRIKDNCVVFVTTGSFIPVFNFLNTAGFPSVHLIYKYDLISSSYLESENSGVICEKLDQVNGLLTDTRSRSVLESILLRAIGGSTDTNLMLSVCDHDQYFVPNLINLSSQECYVDIGAYDGDSVRHFIDASRGMFKFIHAFELDPQNFIQLDKYVHNSPHREKIKTYNLGAWDVECDLFFNQGERQSSLGDGKSKTHAVPLDSLLMNQEITYIKMDVEGAEMHALRGLDETIKRNRPKLAVCVYHHISHLWEVPLYIHRLLPNHKIYLRHHTSLEYETVCYAIPPEIAPVEAEPFFPFRGT